MDLDEIAATQHCAFTARQARASGQTWRTIAAAKSDGTWTEIVRGAYVVTAVYEELDRDGQHNCRLHGRLLVKQAGWAAARRSSVVLHELPLIGFAPDRPQLVRDPGTSRTRGHDRHERIAAVPTADLTVVQGVPTQTLLRTWADFSEEEPFRSAVVLADALLRRDVSRQALLNASRTTVARQAAAFADPLAESALESISRVACRTLALPIPRLQIKVIYAGEEIARVDGLWEEMNTIGQADGALKYKDSARVLKDKWQDERLESLGFEVVRWGWRTAWHPLLLKGPLLRGFERGRAQRIDPGVTLVQATLAESRRRWRRVA